MFDRIARKAWVVAPFEDESGNLSTFSNVADVAEISTDELEIVLPNTPRVGMHLSLQFLHGGQRTRTIVAKVTATERLPEGKGWRVHCMPVKPLTKSKLDYPPAGASAGRLASHRGGQ